MSADTPQNNTTTSQQEPSAVLQTDSSNASFPSPTMTESQDSTVAPRRRSSSSLFRRASGSFSGGGVLARLSSSSSSKGKASLDAQDRRPSLGRRLSSRSSNKSVDGLSKADLAELSKPTGKFKSGIRWDQQQAPEPFMEVSDSAAIGEQEPSSSEAQSALASGSTAAAQAYVKNRGLGQPVFADQTATFSSKSALAMSPKLASLQQPPLPSVSQTLSALNSSGLNPDILPASSTEMQKNQDADLGETIRNNNLSGIKLESEAVVDFPPTPTALTPPLKSRQSSVSDHVASSGENHMVARAAQLVLEAARQQARAETRKKGRSAPASPKRSGLSLSPVDTNTEESTPASTIGTTQTADEPHASSLARSSSRGRSKSDAGGDVKAKSRKNFLRALTSIKPSRSRDISEPSSTGNITPKESDPAATSPSDSLLVAQSASGTTTPNGRRRRYVDTRDLDLLARELAAESIAEQIPQPPFARPSRSGSSSPLRNKGASAAFNDPRRRSFPSILEDAPLQDDSIVAASGAGVPTLTHMDARSDSSSATGSLRGKAHGNNKPATPAGHSNDSAMSMVPPEMFAGLGGSPYPVMSSPSLRSASSALDTSDPFGIPLTNEPSPFDATMAYANRTHVYHSPAQVALSRNQSSISMASQAKQRRPVLTMTMNDPDAELQGLTKPLKGAKRLTPFGSRASSRAPSPSASLSNLKQEAEKQQQQQHLSSDELKTSNAESTHRPDDTTDRPLAASTTSETASVQSHKVAAIETKADIASATASTGASSSASVATVSNGTNGSASKVRSNANSDVNPRTSGLAPPSAKIGRFSSIFRSGRSKSHASRAQANSIHPAASGSETTTPNPSKYGTPTAEMHPISPESTAVSVHSDAEVSPVAFRQIDLAPDPQGDTEGRASPEISRGHKSQTASVRSARPSSDTSGHPKVAAQMTENSASSDGNIKPRPAGAKKGMRTLLRRLSSFGSNGGGGFKAASAKSSFPDASSMPKVDLDLIDRLSRPSAQKGESQQQEQTESKVNEDDGFVSIDLSKEPIALVNQDMAKNGFGTRSAHVLGGDVKQASKGEEISFANGVDGAAPQMRNEGGEEVENRAVPHLLRAESRTPSSEDSAFLSSGNSYSSGPGSGGLYKHGSESAASEELNTPGISTGCLADTKMAEAAFSTALTSSKLDADSSLAANGSIGGVGGEITPQARTMPATSAA